MKSDTAFILGLVTLFALGFLLGWIAAHATVAQECRRLGGFYVGTSVFECQERQAK